MAEQIPPLSKYALKVAAKKLSKAHPHQQAMRAVLATFHADHHEAIMLRMQQLWQGGES